MEPNHSNDFENSTGTVTFALHWSAYVLSTAAAPLIPESSSELLQVACASPSPADRTGALSVPPQCTESTARDRNPFSQAEMGAECGCETRAGKGDDEDIKHTAARAAQSERTAQRNVSSAARSPRGVPLARSSRRPTDPVAAVTKQILVT